MKNISSDSQNPRKVEAVKLGFSFSCVHFCAFSYLKKYIMVFRILALLLLPLICLAQVNSTVEKPTGELLSNEISPNEMKRNASFNLDEIKVRWKKVALENCTGVPCASISAPGPVPSIVATPTGPTSASVAFGTPASDGGSPITGYRATATSISPSASAKRKSSATIIVEGPTSPISITGLVFGVNYTFSVVALNAAGVSPPLVTVTPVTPCTLNTATAGQQQPTLTLNSAIEEPIMIATTTGATGIGTATGLPTGMTATWSNNSIKISGTPTAANTFNYTIPLTGGCGSVNATGTLTVTECRDLEVGPNPNAETILPGIEMAPITISAVNATSIYVSNIPDFFLPEGVTASLVGTVITISGTPVLSLSGRQFTYVIIVVGDCDRTRQISGSIVVGGI